MEWLVPPKSKLDSDDCGNTEVWKSTELLKLDFLLKCHFVCQSKLLTTALRNRTGLISLQLDLSRWRGKASSDMDKPDS